MLFRSHGLFVSCAKEIAREYPDVTVEEFIVDAMAALLVRKPEYFDVILTTNTVGDILSDEASELAGSLGLAASLNHGDRCAVAQAGHGSAPDIAGRDIANPTSLLVSAAMMLEHIGVQRGIESCVAAGRCLDATVDAMLAARETRTPDLGGPIGTRAFGEGVAHRIATGA